MSIIKVYSNPISPFSRRVIVTLKRLGRIFEVITVENLFPPPEALLAVNPLGLIPVLVVDKEDPVCDSNAILDNLDHKFSGVWAKEWNTHWKEKRVSHMAAGLMETSVSWRYESIRADARSEVLNGKEQTALRLLSNLTRTVQTEQKKYFQVRKSQDAIDIAIALDYLSFRLSHLNWESKFPILQDLFLEFKEDEKFLETSPK